MGDEGHLEEFYALEYARLVGALTLLAGNRADAHEAVDEALGRAWEQLRRGRELENLAAWVRVVAVNLLRGGLRRRSVERRVQTRLVSVSTEASTEDVALGAVDVHRALAGLSRRQREVVVLHYLLDLSVAQVASELRLRDGTVKSMLSRARAALAAVLTSEPAEADHDAPS